MRERGKLNSRAGKKGGRHALALASLLSRKFVKVVAERWEKSQCSTYMWTDQGAESRWNCAKERSDMTPWFFDLESGQKARTWALNECVLVLSQSNDGDKCRRRICRGIYSTTKVSNCIQQLLTLTEQQ